MRIVRVAALYPDYLHNFYKKNPDLFSKTYDEQSKALNYDAFSQFDQWALALRSYGYEFFYPILNAEFMQRAWAYEQGLSDYKNMRLEDILLAQLERIKPEVLWYSHNDVVLLERIRDKIPSIRLVLGWVGSAIPKTDIWRDMDAVLSCAPESVEFLRSSGVTARHMNHAFIPQILDRINNGAEKIQVSFIGQIVRQSDFHLNREALLVALCEQVNMEIFSSSSQVTLFEDVKSLLKGIAFDGVGIMKKLGVSPHLLTHIPRLNKVINWTERPRRIVNPQLKPYLRTAVYGLEMYQVLRDSKVTLNSHADSSPLYASNMRLFETTGVGTCLITDWRDNLPELFTPDKEVVTYRTIPECVEKTKWLLDNPEKCRAIAQAGQNRTLREHTFAHRAVDLDRIIRELLA